VTVPQAILIGSAIIALAIVGSQFVAPYRLASGTAMVWRLNAVTGEMRLCNSEINVREPLPADACR
jgi:hypothetical protein